MSIFKSGFSLKLLKAYLRNKRLCAAELREIQSRMRGVSLSVKPRANVIFYAPTELGFGRTGKVSDLKYFSAFADTLHSFDVQPYFLMDAQAANDVIKMDIPTVVILVYGEDIKLPQKDDLPELIDSADVVFNDLSVGSVAASKIKTNRFFEKHNVPTPRLVKEATETVFSNELEGSNRPVAICEVGDELDENRFNTEFINTRFDYEGSTYFTSLRLMCVGPEIIDVLARARSINDESPSVHTKDTPLNDMLINEILEKSIEKYLSHFCEIAEMISSELGLGFYAHDILIDWTQDRLVCCETGLKLFDDDFSNHFQSIRDKLNMADRNFCAKKYGQASSDCLISSLQKMHII